MESDNLVRRAAKGLVAYGPALVPSRLGPPNRFVVLGSPRIGSRLLLTLLRNQPGVFCDFEILNPRNNRIRFPFQWVQGHAMRAAWRRPRVYGFKVFVHHLRDLPLVDGAHAFVDRLAEAGYLVVVLTRRNLLRQAISHQYAQLAGRHHVIAGEELEDRALPIDPVQLILRMCVLEMENDFARTAGDRVRHVDVSYEDDLFDSSNHQATVDRIMSALGVSSVPVRHTRLQRTSRDDLRDQVANWDEIVDVLSRTRFAKFLED